MATNAEKRLQFLQQTITPQKMVEVGYPVFVQNTPQRSGNARKRTGKTATSIRADYPYAVRLDNGWSKQSPKGMTKPTIEAVRKWIARQ